MPMNAGLMLMVGLILLPVGLAHMAASMRVALWYARSADFLHLPWLQTPRWLRIVGDTVLSAGFLPFAWFMAGLRFGWSCERRPEQAFGLAQIPVR
jgi:nitric oxide reductase subunit B